MHKATAKILVLLVSIISCLVLFSCADPNNTKEDDTPTKEELYEAMIGTWILEETDETDPREIPGSVGSKISLTKETFKNVTTIEEMRKINEGSKSDLAKQSVIETINRYSFADYDLCFYSAYEAMTVYDSRIRSFTGYKIYNEKLHIIHYAYIDSTIIQYYQKIYRQDEPSSENNNDDNTPETSITESEITGSYTISEANGSTFTFASGGTWTYKYSSSTAEGTWSVSDGELTITYSLGGYSSTAVFTASVSGDTYTLTGKSGDYTTIISSAFKITDQSALENGVVTLVKQ